VANVETRSCVCDHTVGEHTQTPDDTACTLCDCLDFCPPAVADEITTAIYEWALEDGEQWADAAHEYRRRRGPTAEST
jgi:glutamine synthetase type III